jgi:hypothetical protein
MAHHALLYGGHSGLSESAGHAVAELTIQLGHLHVLGMREPDRLFDLRLERSNYPWRRKQQHQDGKQEGRHQDQSQPDDYRAQLIPSTNLTQIKGRGYSCSFNTIKPLTNLTSCRIARANATIPMA